MTNQPIANFMKMYDKYVATTSDIKDIKVRTLPSASWGLRHMVGHPGYPIEHIVEVYGPPGVGKTTFANYIMRLGQKKLKKPVYLADVESKFQIEYAKTCGVDTSDDMFVIGRDFPDGETAMETVLAAVQSKAFSVVILDSIAALAMRAAIDGDLTDATIGIDARQVTRFIKRLTVQKSNSNTAIMLINQVRDKIGAYGNPEKTPGGWALEFHSALRIRVSRGEQLKAGTKILGYNVKLKAYKNSLGEPWLEAKLPLVYGKGILPSMELLTTCKELGIVTGAGGNYKIVYPGIEASLGRGLAAACKSIKQHAKVLSPVITKRMKEERAKIQMEVIE